MPTKNELRHRVIFFSWIFKLENLLSFLVYITPLEKDYLTY